MKIEGKKVILRPWRESDATQLAELVQDRQIPRFTRVPSPYKLKDAKQFIRERKEKWKKKSDFGFAIISKKEKQLLGSIGICRVDMRDKKTEMGYWIGNPFRRKGYASEAIALMFDFAFKKLGLNRIVIKCDTKNKASRKVIEKAGAKFEGIEREGGVSGIGKKMDLCVYSILMREFKGKKFK